VRHVRRALQPEGDADARSSISRREFLYGRHLKRHHPPRGTRPRDWPNRSAILAVPWARRLTSGDEPQRPPPYFFSDERPAAFSASSTPIRLSREIESGLVTRCCSGWSAAPGCGVRSPRPELLRLRPGPPRTNRDTRRQTTRTAFCPSPRRLAATVDTYISQPSCPNPRQLFRNRTRQVRGGQVHWLHRFRRRYLADWPASPFPGRPHTTVCGRRFAGRTCDAGRAAARGPVSCWLLSPAWATLTCA